MLAYQSFLHLPRGCSAGRLMLSLLYQSWVMPGPSTVQWHEAGREKQGRVFMKRHRPWPHSIPRKLRSSRADDRLGGEDPLRAGVEHLFPFF